MPDIDYPYLPEGLAFTADSLNTRFSTVTNGVNDLMDYSGVAGTFHESHLPSMVPGLGTGLTATYPLSSGYTNEYTTFGSNSGWEVIGVGANKLEINFTQISLGMDQADYIAGLYVLMNVVFQYAQPLNPAGTGGENIWAAFCIQWSDDLVTPVWNTISRTERFISGLGLAANDQPLPGSSASTTYPDGTGGYQEVAIRTLILPSDITPGTTIRGIRGAVAMYIKTAPTPGPTRNVGVGQGSISVIPLHAKVMT